MDKNEFNLDAFLASQGIKHDLKEDYKCYEKFFPDLGFRTFSKLNHYGKLGRLIRGLRIDLPQENNIMGLICNKLFSVPIHRP